MKKCSGCKTAEVVVKGLCPPCKKEYNKNWYQKNREEQLHRVQQNNKRYSEEVTNFLQMIKDVPCADCGHRYPHYVMDFDHLGKIPKFMSISRMKFQRRTLASIKKEIEKCQIVCSNCHRERTYRRSKALIA